VVLLLTKRTIAPEDSDDLLCLAPIVGAMGARRYDDRPEVMYYPPNIWSSVMLERMRRMLWI
jgi:hypothetical protein